MLGVGGTTERIPVENERSRLGVWMVRFVGRRREVLGTATGAPICCGSSRIGAVHKAGRDWLGGGSLSERFFRLRPFLGASDFIDGKNASADGGRVCVSPLTAYEFDLMVGKGGMEVGDSGEELGDGSTMIGESKVELVVVGDESVDSEAIEIYSRG